MFVFLRVPKQMKRVCLLLRVENYRRWRATLGELVHGCKRA